MQCPECGLELRGSESVCPRCLTRLVSPAREEERAVPTPSAEAEVALPPDLEADLAGIAVERARPKRVPRGRQVERRAAPRGGAPPPFLWVASLLLAAITVGAFAAVAVALTRRDATYHLKQANAWYANGQYELALAAYLRALEADDKLPEAQNGAGQCYLGMGHARLAIAHLQRAASSSPRLFEAHLGLGTAYSDVRMWPEAEASLRKALDLRKDDPSATRALGYVYYQEQRYDEAIPLLEQLTRFQPKDALAQEYLGRCLYARERYDEALGPLRAAVELDGYSAPARQYLGLVEQKLGRCDWAVEQFRLLQTAYPDDPTWYAYTGQCLYEEERYDEAIAHLNQALALSHADQVLSKSHLYMGWSHYQQGRYEAALASFQRALIMEPRGMEAVAAIGWCQVRLGKCKEAKPLFEQALRADPYLGLARDGLAACP